MFKQAIGLSFLAASVTWFFGNKMVFPFTNQPGRGFAFSKVSTKASTRNVCVLGNLFIAYTVMLSGPGVPLFFVFDKTCWNAFRLI